MRLEWQGLLTWVEKTKYRGNKVKKKSSGEARYSRNWMKTILTLCYILEYPKAILGQTIYHFEAQEVMNPTL